MARTKASIVVMSHLSDAHELLFFKHLVSAGECINFAKYIILQTGGNLNQEIDAKEMLAKFNEKTPILG